MNKTVFIVGAGASREVDLPTGPELREVIASTLNLRFADFGKQTHGDPLIMEALRYQVSKATSPDERDLNLYAHAARRISEGMPLAPSIDHFLDAHRGDKLIELCGKLGIVKAILHAESGSRLYTDPRRPDIQLKHGMVADTWFNAFWQIFCEGCTASEIENRARSIEFVIFNYDRCIERFLTSATQAYYGLSESDAANVVSQIKIYHPYGSIGALPGFGVAPAIGYGAEIHAQHLLRLALEIKTFTEGTDPNSSEIAAIRASVNQASKVVFLGFAFHPINLNLLWPPGRTERRTTRTYFFGTAHGISAPDMAVISRQLAEITGLAGLEPDLIRLRALKCSELFHEFRRGLAL